MSTLKTFELSKVQEEIWNKYGQNVPNLGISFHCNKRIVKEEIQKIWSQLSETHQMLLTELEIPKQSTRPVQQISTDSNVEIFEVDEKDTQNFQAKFQLVFKKQKNQFGGWIVMFEKNKDTTKIILGASSLLTDKWSLMHLASCFLKSIQGNTLEEVLPYAQFSEWHKNALDDDNIEAKRFWEERVHKDLQEKSNNENYDIIENYKASIKINSGSNQSNKAIFYAIAATTFLRHHGDEKLRINYINDGRYFEELNAIVGPFSLPCPLEISNKEITRLVAVLESELEEQKSMLVHHVPTASEVSSNIIFEFLEDNESLTSEWNFEETQQTEDLKFEFVKVQNQITLTIRYKSKKHNSEYIHSLSEQILTRIKSYFEKGASNDSNLPEEVLARIYKVSSGATKEINPNFIFERLELANVKNQAICFDGKSITYGELKNAVDHLAIYYSKQGIETNAKVGLYLPGNVHYITSLLSLWKLGVSVIPVSKNTPLGRLESCLQLAKASHIVSDTEIEITKLDVKLILANKSLNTNTPKTKVERIEYDDKTPAYILFTSGSTGDPKGCQISHYNLSNYLSWASEYYLKDTSELANFPFFTSVGFDFTFTSILLPIVNSGCIWIQENKKTFDEHLVAIANNANLDYVKLTPSHISALKSLSIDKFLPNNVILGGEALTSSLVKFLESINPNINIYNEYGPTEATVGCVVTKVTSKDKIVPIGVPIDNTSIYVVNDKKNLLSEYCIGQLIISGASLSGGYINSQLNTSFNEADKVIPSRHYYTGDIGYRDISGQLYFLGRKDDQVKIRGNRIELSEITIAAESFDAVEQAIVDIDESSESIILYVKTSESNISVDLELCLKNQLMPYALPNNIVEITYIPLNENGKADFKELRNMMNTTTVFADVEVLETMPSYKILCKLWKEILNVEKVNPKDHFIKGGGDSIKAIQLVNKLRQEGYEINIREVLENPILVELNTYLANKMPGQNVIEFVKDEGEIMLNPNQQNFLEYAGDKANGYCQSMRMKISEKVTQECFQKSIEYVLRKHPMLNARYTKEGEQFKQYISQDIEASCLVKYMTQHEFLLERKKQPIYELINIKNGPLALFYLVHKDEEYSLYVYAHHLIIDAVSWRILIEDISKAMQVYKKDIHSKLDIKSGAYFGSRTASLIKQSEDDTSFWETELLKLKNQDDWLTGPFLFKYFKQVEFFMNNEVSNQLKGVANNRYETHPIELLLTAIARAYKKINGTDFCCIMENNGRQSIKETPDVEGSIGWFTSMYPVTVSLSDSKDLKHDITHVYEKYRSVPYNGVFFPYQYGHSVLPIIQLNYLGMYEVNDNDGFQIEADEFASQNIHPELDMRIGLAFSIVFGENGLHIVLSYDSSKISEKWSQEFSELVQFELAELAEFCVRDLELKETLDYKQLDDSDLEDIIGDL
jgi:amino acid adenylation domain-containing protein